MFPIEDSSTAPSLAACFRIKPNKKRQEDEGAHESVSAHLNAFNHV